MDWRLAYTIKKLEENGMTDCSQCGHRPDYIEWLVHIAEAAIRFKVNKSEKNETELLKSVDWLPNFD